MLVNELFLDGFRNYHNETVRFGSGVNVLAGSNAQGKTNLIEAIYYLASGRSFRHGTDKDLISFDRDGACVRAGVLSGDREQTLEIRLFRDRRRELFANGVKLKRVSELTGRITVVQFGPDELDMIKDGAAIRRKLMDQCLSQLRPVYLAALTEYNKLYENKLKILRNFHEKPSLLELLDDFNLRPAQQSARLIYYRTAFATSLSRRAANIHSEFSGGSETLAIRYKTVGGMDATGKKPSEILPDLLENQSQLYQAELKTGSCLSGAHKDDLEIDINGVPARKYGSQGQMRTASVSVKLAEREIHRDDRGEYPILLLDDVLSELDEYRQNYVLGKIADGQVFITTCDEKAISYAYGSTLLRVEGGRLREDNSDVGKTFDTSRDIPNVHDYCV